jgi:hypothetical protein
MTDRRPEPIASACPEDSPFRKRRLLCTWTFRSRLGYDLLMLRVIVFFGLAAPALASPTLDVLVNAAASFSATIQQLESDLAREYL